MGLVFTHLAHTNSPLLIAASGEDEKDPSWWLPYLAHLDSTLWILL